MTRSYLLMSSRKALMTRRYLLMSGCEATMTRRYLLMNSREAIFIFDSSGMLLYIIKSL